MAADPDTGFDVPTLESVVNGIKDDVNARMTGADAYLPYIGKRLRRRVTNAFAVVLGGALWSKHAFIARALKQLFPHIAPDWGVLAWADILGIARVDAEAGDIEIDVTGTNGTVIPSGTTWVAANGDTFTSTSNVTIAAGVGLVPALADQAKAVEVVVASPLTVTAPLSGLDADADVASIVGTGRDQETIEELRVRVLERMRRRGSTGTQGNATDYATWTREALSSVDKVWVRTPSGGANPGEVEVRFTTTDGPIPSAGERTTVLDYIKGTSAEDYTDGQCPANASPQVPELTGEATTFDLTITPDTSAQQALVEAELDALWDRESEPGGTIYLWQIYGAIDAAGVETLTVNTINGTTPADVAATSIDHLTTRGTVTFS